MNEGVTEAPASQREHSEARRHQEDGVRKRELPTLRRLEGKQVSVCQTAAS